MTTETQKKHHHHHHHRHPHHQKKMLHLKSIERITSLPVVESAHAYYEKIKKSSTLIKWSLIPAETGVWLAVGTAMPVVSFFEKPVSAVDSIACKALDIIENNLPVVTYPPDLVYNITKDYVTSKVVNPMLKRADSVKQMSISGASICGEIAADRLNNAIDVADQYVEKYLPEITDGSEGTEAPVEAPPDPLVSSDSKTAKTINHVNQFGRKLQRRLTRRTIAEAKALKQQGADTIRCLIYLVDLLSKDPKAFMEKAKAMWLELSKDEPENQAPPQNLEQLIAMLTREMARRIVHLTNYTGTKVVLLTQYTLHAVHVAALNVVWWADYFLKTLHLEWALEFSATQITKLHHFSIETLAKLVELVKKLKEESLKAFEKKSLPSLESSPQPSSSQTQPQSLTVPVPTTPENASRHSSASSSPSTVTSAKSTQSQNGETHTVAETNHGTPA